MQEMKDRIKELEAELQVRDAEAAAIMETTHILTKDQKCLEEAHARLEE